MAYTLASLASALGLDYRGDGERQLRSLASLDSAQPDQLSFVASKKYLSALKNSCAGAVIIAPELAQRTAADCLLSAKPYTSFAEATQLFDTQPVPVAGIHPTAQIHASACLGSDVSIAANVSVGAGAVLGDGVVLGAGVVVGENVKLGAGTRLHPNVVLYHSVELGEQCTVHAQTVIGADGFGFAPSPEGWVKISQLGSVRIGNRVDIGASVTIDRGALEDTVIADGVIIDNQVHIAHNCRIGKNTALAGCVGLAGSTIIGENCTLAGMVGVSGHLEICDGVHLTGQARVTKSITEPGSYASGTALAPMRDWGRNAVRFNQLETMNQRLKALEKALQSREKSPT
ncbi:MAG: UDP-3-O-(3-hydroxymyristoyl)glucosamine N-acyltransferase [Gammaproteobacteria bacterium]|nr:MAG: UDP-3-O-(3-hydroxymyristoyl)glucosamine N-acyltransferase [Gammaproteobacteria bacterium]